jgi:hypothetical protein
MPTLRIDSIEDATMTTRRMAYWWFRFVISGRFLEKFLNLRPMRAHND